MLNWLYSIGLVVIAVLLVWHGTMTVMGEESIAMIAGKAGLGGILLTAGLSTIVRRTLTIHVAVAA